MKAQLDAQRGAVGQLIDNTKVLETKLVEAKSKKDTLKARARSAATSKQVAEMVQGLDTSNAVVAFERMEEKVMALEAESEATLALAAPDETEKRFKALEGGSGIDGELAELKAKALGGGRSGPPPSLPAGRVPDSIDFELEELRRKAAE
jgi:phage shock protein A